VITWHKTTAGCLGTSLAFSPVLCASIPGMQDWASLCMRFPSALIHPIPVPSGKRSGCAPLRCDNPRVVYEWIGTVALGLAGIGATLLAGKFERGHSQRMADEARQQERLADAYVRLLVLVERVGQWAQMVMPLMDTDPPQPVRPLPGSMSRPKRRLS
jgi:hypothetical protein